MRCYICDKEDSLITVDRITLKSNPCGVCQDVINECLEGYGPEDNEEEDDYTF